MGPGQQREPTASVIVVSTYPPTRCGLATYSDSLIRGLMRLRGVPHGLSVARVLAAATSSRRIRL